MTDVVEAGENGPRLDAVALKRHATADGNVISES